MNICNFCNTSFYNKSNLTKHQKTSKSCLVIQNGLKNQLNIIQSVNQSQTTEKQKNIFQCEYCTKTLSSKQMLNGHLDICKIKKKHLEDEDNRFKKITLEMTMMKEELEKLKNKSTTNNITITTNNTDNSSSVNNYCSLLNYMTPEVVRESFKNFNINNLLSGSQKELADMTIKNFLTGKDHPLYLCKDRSRNKFVYTDEENKEKEDANAIVLRTLVYNGIAPLLKKLYQEEYVKLHDELARCKRIDDNALIETSRDDIKELDEAYKQFNILKEAEDYISHLSKCLPTSIKDRIYKDGLKTDLLETETKQSNSDVEFEKQLQMIGDYTLSELKGFKENFKATGIVKGPKDLIQNKSLIDIYVAFLKE